MRSHSVDYCRASHRATISSVARGCSAVGSASPCQGEGRGFESRHPLEGAIASIPAVEWPSGEATACKAVHTGSIPVSTSSFLAPGAISSAGERFPDTEEVTGSNPVRPTAFFEILSSDDSPNGSQPPAVLALRCWSERLMLRSKYGDSQAWHAQRRAYRAAVAVIRTRFMLRRAKACGLVIAPNICN